MFSAAWELSSWRSGTIKKTYELSSGATPALYMDNDAQVLSFHSYTIFEFISGISPLPFYWRLLCVERFRSVLNYCGFKLSDCSLNCGVDLVFLCKLSCDEWKVETAHSYEMPSNSTFKLQTEFWRTRFNSASVLRMEVSFITWRWKLIVWSATLPIITTTNYMIRIQ